MGTVCYSKLQLLASGYSGLQQVITVYRVVTVGYSRLPSGYSGLQQDTEGYRAGYISRLPSVTSYSRLPSGYSGLQQVTEWLHWVTAGYSRFPSG